MIDRHGPSDGEGVIEERSQDAGYFDERADRFREVERELGSRARVSAGDGETVGEGERTIATPAAYGTIDDVRVVATAELPEWYRARAARGETLAQRLEGHGLEARPGDGGAGSEELFAAEEYLRLDVSVDGATWDTYVPVPRTPDEYESSALAMLRERLDGRPIGRFHCARMPIRYEDGRYMPDYGARTHGRWLREQGFVRWVEGTGYELKPGLRVPALVARGVALSAGALLAGSVTVSFFLVQIPELFAIWLWFVLPMAYLYAGSLTRSVFRVVFGRLGRARRADR